MKKMRMLLVFLMVMLIPALVACSEDQNGIEKDPDDVVNLKSVAVQGGWVYHFKRDMVNAKAVPGLYKTQPDNSETVLISEDLGLFLIVEDDWIYYGNISRDNTDAIYKIKTDGTEKTKLSDDSIMSSMSGKGSELDGDWLYYLSTEEEGSLYRVKTDGSLSEKLGQGGIYSFELNGDWIYHNVSEDGPGMYKMKKDGSESRLVFEGDAVLIDVSDDHIYFSDGSGNNLQRANLDGLDVEDLNIDNIYLLTAKDGWIYYITQPSIPTPDNQLYRVRDDGSDMTKLTDNDSFFMEVVGDWIYYVATDAASNSFKLNKMKTDGSGKETLRAEGFFIFLNW